jgi:glycosyltransferase involved in cell wall biosynthesis
MTVNEGLAVGVPLVVTDSINYSEVQSSGAGYVVGRDAAELANAIDAILQAPDKSKEMRIAGRRFANEQLSWIRVASLVNDAYSDVIEGFGNQVKNREVLRDRQIGVSA